MGRMTADQKEIRGHPPHPRYPRSYFDLVFFLAGSAAEGENESRFHDHHCSFLRSLA
jgi:hypothetical protein